SPELCARIAELPNIVAIKYSVPREMYARLTRLAGDKLIVSTASEEEWFDNTVELGWRLYLCSSPPYLFQTKVDRRMRKYTDLAFAGEVAKAKAVRDSLNPVLEAFRRSRPPEKPPSHSKYWQELLGQVGGRVRLDPIYKKLVELDVTMQVHMGWTPCKNAPMRFQQPYLLDDVGARFPELKVVIAHVGWPWVEECLAVVAKWENF